MGNLFLWLFTDPATEAGGKNGDPTPFNPVPWLIVMGVFVLAIFYYNTEARRNRWIRDHLIWKQYVYDRMLRNGFGGQLGLYTLVGLFLIGMRIVLYFTLFAWRFWMGAWILWGVGLVVYWLYYFATKHTGLIVAFEKNVARQKFMPSSNRNKRRTASLR